MNLTQSRSTRTVQIVKAPRAVVYQVFLKPEAVASWLAPDLMSGHMELFEPQVGGKFRMSLTYLDQAAAPRGKTTENTDTFEGKFVELRPNEQIVWVVEFESQQADFAGEMKITWSLKDVDGGTEVAVLFENIPMGIRLEDNELGSRQSLRKLAAYVEHGTVVNSGHD